jgi:hypothetical protein
MMGRHFLVKATFVFAVALCAIKQLHPLFWEGNTSIDNELSTNGRPLAAAISNLQLRECTQNPYLDAIGPLQDATEQMDIWLRNRTAAGKRASKR